MSHAHDSLRKLSTTPVNRRRAVASLGALGIIAASGTAAHAFQATPTTTDGIEVAMPDWRFSLIETHDPYAGTVTKPDVVPAEVRVVACQVMLTNMSDQPMEFRVTDVRVRDSNGVEYRAGEYLGTEPRLVSQNLPDGERTRGWVWVALPTDVEPASVVFVAPPPVLQIEIP